MALTKNYMTYPCKVINISQRHDGTYSHSGNSSSSANYKDYPIDEVCDSSSSRSYMYCPCDEMEVLRVHGVGNGGTNTVWLRSTSPVYIPGESTPQYVVMMVVHPNDDTLNGVYVGRKYTRNEPMFTEGNDGRADGYHFHISCGTGELATTTGWVENNLGAWVLRVTGRTLLPTEAFYRYTNFTSIVNTNGYSFRTVSTY